MINKTIVIIGPTASGKTGLSIRLAKKYNGEVISADSRAIYKYMDIGTAKPTKGERDGVAHFGIDLVYPDEKFTAFDFKRYALERIKEIKGRGKTPFLVGGSGLYVDAVIYDYDFSDKPVDLERRKKLNEMSVQELTEYCIKHNVTLPNNEKNKRYLVRAIENIGRKPNNNRNEIQKDFLVVGISTSRTGLEERIRKRADAIFSSNIFKESEYLLNKYDLSLESMKSNIYPIISKVLKGEISESVAKEMFIQSDLRLVKKQLTWFKRNSQIKWLPLRDAEEYIASVLSNK